MIEKDAGAGKQAIGFAVVGHLPESGGLGHRVGAARAKGGVFVAGGIPVVAKAFAGAGAVVPDRAAEKADGLQQVERAEGDAFQRLHGLLEGQADGTLPRQVVDLVRLVPRQYLQDAAKVVAGHGRKFDLAPDAQANQVVEAADLGIARGADHSVAAR